MVVIVTPTELFPGRANFVKELLKLEPNITTIVQNIQSRDTSIVLGTKERVLYGKGFIIDELCGLKFKLSPRSFFQINPPQTEKLYQNQILRYGKNEAQSVCHFLVWAGVGDRIKPKTCIAKYHQWIFYFVLSVSPLYDDLGAGLSRQNICRFG